jgi:hypothetical protein
VWPNICEERRTKNVILFLQVDSGWPDQLYFPRDVAAWWFKCGSNGTDLSERNAERDGLRCDNNFVDA